MQPWASWPLEPMNLEDWHAMCEKVSDRSGLPMLLPDEYRNRTLYDVLAVLRLVHSLKTRGVRLEEVDLD